MIILGRLSLLSRADSWRSVSQNSWWRIFSAILLFIGIPSGISFSLENASIGSPTIPQSSLQSGLVRTPSPYGTSPLGTSSTTRIGEAPNRSQIGQLWGMDGNLIVTGNIAGGKHFRDSVPYSSTTSFTAPIGSSTLDSFLRQSSGSDDFHWYSGGYRPFYSPSATVSRVPSNYSYVPKPTATGVSDRISDAYMMGIADDEDLEELAPEGLSPQLGVVSEESSISIGTELQSVAPPTTARAEETATNEFLERISQHREWRKPSLSEELDQTKESLSEKDYQQLMEELHLELQQISDQARQLSDSISHPSQEDKADLELLRRDLRVPAEPTIAQGGQEALGYTIPENWRVSKTSEEAEFNQLQPAEKQIINPLDVDAQLVPAKSQAGARPEEQFVLHRTFGFSSATQEESQRSILDENRESKIGMQASPSYTRGERGQSAEKREPRMWEPAWLETIKESLPGANLSLRERASKRRVNLYQDDLSEEELLLETELAEQSKSTESTLQQLSRLSDAEISARAKQILGSHTSLESFSQERFNHHFEAGQDYLRQGKYRQAIDAFTLASMYKKSSPVAYAGKSHALFAVGEYASSALFLARTLEVYPAYAQLKVDLVGIMGGKEKLNHRIAEAQDCLKYSDSPELRFLLAYVYLQLDRLDEARQAIDKAYSVTYGTSPLGASSQDIPLAKAIQTLKKAIENPQDN